MKRLSILLTLLLSTAVAIAGGIGSAKDLVAFAEAANKGAELTKWQNDKGEICLECDIDMSKVKRWSPIKEFGGIFDGRGFALVGWATTCGLFDLVTAEGEVRNLRIDTTCSMNIEAAQGEIIAGFIARVSKGLVENCENGGAIIFKTNRADGNISIGGLVGQNGYVVSNSRNSAPISVECLVASTNSKQSIFVGGVVGRTVPKSRGYYTLIRCENSGALCYNGDIPRAFVGGVVGRSYSAGIRICNNRGDVKASFAKGANGIRGYSYVGGVVGNTEQHVQCSDNFGKITAEGDYSTSLAGVCGSVSAAKNIIGCSNYGEVVSLCTDTTYIGGVLGVSKSGAHLCNNTNYGAVWFGGNSLSDVTYMGGVVGCLVSKKDLRFGSYVRRCNNFGAIRSDIEEKRLRAGGVAGFVKGSEAAPINIVDCANKGLVNVAGSLAGDIASRISGTTVEGEYFHNNYAEAVESLEGESNLYGRVTSTTGEPVAGAVVSDGSSSVLTDNNGYYRIGANLEEARFVTISTPSEYKLSFERCALQNFKRIPRHAKAVVANFVLEKREKPLDKYTVIMMGDPQIRGVGVDSAVYRLKNFVYPDVAALKTNKGATDDEFFAINLGDLLFNDMTKFDDFIDCAESSGFPMLHVIGNHDHDQTTILDTRLGTMHFEEYMNPINYSFNIGKVHYVVLDNISWSRKTTKQPYDIGLDEFVCKWLEQDLQFVPKEHTIVVCSHAQLFRRPLPVHMSLPNNPDLNSGDKVNFATYSKLFAPFAKVYTWSGHYHYNFGYDYSLTNEVPQYNNITSICVARCCGGLHVSRYLFNDGTPSGYMVVEVDGNDMKWYYKSEGYDRSHQMNIYAPTRTGGELVKVNIWNWSADYWSQPEWWEQGKRVGYMTHKPEKDIAYLEDYSKQGPFLGRKGDDKAVPHEAHGTFHIKPSKGVRSGEVRVTDNFGVTYIEKVEW